MRVASIGVALPSKLERLNLEQMKRIGNNLNQIARGLRIRLRESLDRRSIQTWRSAPGAFDIDPLIKIARRCIDRQ